ncbi:hypothetical protein Plhal304r1_c041g0119281 [Plasmopara halstedii]
MLPHVLWMQRLVVMLQKQMFFLTPWTTIEKLVHLKKVTYDNFLHDLKFDDITEVVLLLSKVDAAEIRSSSVMDDSVLEEL